MGALTCVLHGASVSRSWKALMSVRTLIRFTLLAVIVFFLPTFVIGFAGGVTGGDYNEPVFFSTIGWIVITSIITVAVLPFIPWLKPDE